MGAQEKSVRGLLVAMKRVCRLEEKELLEGPEWHEVIFQRGQSGEEALLGIVLMGAQKKWGQVKTGRGSVVYVGALEEPVREALVATKGVCWLEVQDFLVEGPEWHAVIRQGGLPGKEARFDIVLMGAREKWGQVNAAERRKGWRLL